MKSFFFIIMITCTVIPSAWSQSTAAFQKPCATDPVYRAFDFWIGEWEAFGKNGKKAGDSHISLILDSCIILEEWTGTSGYAGKSYNTYNSGTGQWQQTWVDNKGGVRPICVEKRNPARLSFWPARLERMVKTTCSG